VDRLLNRVRTNMRTATVAISGQTQATQRCRFGLIMHQPSRADCAAYLCEHSEASHPTFFHSERVNATISTALYRGSVSHEECDEMIRRATNRLAGLSD